MAGKGSKPASAGAVVDSWAPSTTFVWRRVRIAGSPQGQKGQPPKASSLRRLSRRNMRDRLTVTMKYRGGAEGWVEIEGRGVTMRVPGHRAVIDVLRALNNDW